MPARMLPLLPVLLAALAGCVAPEPPPVAKAIPASSGPAAPPRTDLQPAPRANRAMKAPEGPAVMQVEGMGRPKQPMLP